MIKTIKNTSLLYLTGFMGSGKSTIGSALAQSIGFSFFDLDLLIEQHTGKSIADIFKDEGGIFFRTLENELLKDLSQGKDSVIALGGGTLLETENLFIVKNSGFMIWLIAELPEIWKRVSVLEKRHLLEIKDKKSNAINDEEEIYTRIECLLKIRQPYYEESELFMDTTYKSIPQIVNELIFELKSRKVLF